MPQSPSNEHMFQYGNAEAFEKLQIIRDAVRAGDTATIEKVLSSSDYLHHAEHIFFQDIPFAIDAYEYIWAQSCYVAIEAGVDALEAGRIYEHYRRMLVNTRSVSELLQYDRQFHVSIASLVHSASRETLYSPVVRVCRSYIREHIREGLTARDVAEALGYSRGYLSEVFKKETGQTVYGFIQALKLAESIELIASPSIPTSQVWAVMGFCSQSHFIEFFKKQTGKTPKQFEKDLPKTRQDERAASSRETRSSREEVLSLSEDPATRDVLNDLYDYAEKAGFKQQFYYLYCVQKGRVEELRKELEDTRFRERMRELFHGNREIALATFTYLVPQISGAAVDGGLSMRKASDLYIRLSGEMLKADTEGLLELLDRAFLEYTEQVALNRGDQH